MDCKEFNDYLTEYEARKLSKSKEMEFLEHKNSCSECREILDLVINHENLYNFDEFNNENTENNVIVRDTIMDKISNMEYTGYNFRKSNILNIVFGTVFIGIIIFGVIEIGKYPLDRLSNSVYDNVEKFALAFENGSILVINTYVHNLSYVAISFIALAFLISILECRKLKNVKGKSEIKSYKS